MTRAPDTGLEPATFFVARVPLLPEDVLRDWARDLRLPTASDAELEVALAADRATLLARLRAHVADPVFREAVFCASPSLNAGVSEWLRDPASPRAANVATILVRYLFRAAARATPFGLFSSCGAGTVGPGSTRLSIAEAPVARHTRLDMQYLTGLVQELEKRPEVRAALRYEPSTGLHRVGAQIHHAEAEHRGEPKTRAYRLVSFDATSSLEVVFARARGGARPAELVAALCESDPEIGAASAQAYVDELIESQALVSELSLPLTGAEPIHHVIGVLRRLSLGTEWVAALEDARDRLAALDAAGVGHGEEPYLEIERVLAGLPAPVERSRLFQVDLVRSARGSHLGSDVMAEIDRGVALLRRLAVPPGPTDMTAFAAAFRERWESREVPLCEALDDEVGIGFGGTSTVPSGLLDTLPFPARPGEFRPRFGPREAWIARRVVALAGAGGREWVLDDDDLRALCADEPPALPPSCGVVATLAARSPEALAAGEFLVLVSVGGGGADMLGRFCHGDPELHERVSDHLRAEEARCPDAILAEIVHQPEGRVGNILLRPVLRDYEIPYLARAGVDPERRIELSDLLVSVTSSGVVRLRSQRLGKWVEPRMATAHNPRTISLGVYRFLCALRSPQDAGHAGWSWGPIGGAAAHLPRVRHGRVVLAVEQWTLDRGDLAPLEREDETSRHRALRALRRRLALPRLVAVVDRDNVLRIDLDDVLACDSFLALSKGRTHLTLTEVFPSEGEQVVEGPRGRHTAEIIIPRIAAAPAARPPTPAGPPRIVRTFAPGSNWLFARLTAGPATCDAVLREVIAPLLDEARASGAADRWFFIRYADPHHHLRLRLRGAPDRLAAETLPSLHHRLAPWLGDGRVHRLTIDTYDREVERYGGDAGIEACEALFDADSTAVLKIVGDLDGLTDADARWRLALVGMDRLLDDLGLDLGQKHLLLADVRAAFAAEHHADPKLERALGARFRLHRKEIEALLEGHPPAAPRAIASGLAHLAARSEASVGPAAVLVGAAREGRLAATLESVAASLLHMHCNRMLAADHRAQELVLYDFLLRVYASREARARRGAPEVTT